LRKGECRPGYRRRRSSSPPLPPSRSSRPLRHATRRCRHRHHPSSPPRKPTSRGAEDPTAGPVTVAPLHPFFTFLAHPVGAGTPPAAGILALAPSPSSGRIRGQGLPKGKGAAEWGTATGSPVDRPPRSPFLHLSPSPCRGRDSAHGHPRRTGVFSSVRQGRREGGEKPIDERSRGSGGERAARRRSLPAKRSCCTPHRRHAATPTASFALLHPSFTFPCQPGRSGTPAVAGIPAATPSPPSGRIRGKGLPKGKPMPDGKPVAGPLLPCPESSPFLHPFAVSCDP